MKLLINAAAGLVVALGAGRVEAAVQEYDLTYSYTLQVTYAAIDSSYQWVVDEYAPYLPAIGSVISDSLSMYIRLDDLGRDYCETAQPSFCELREFDPLTGDIYFQSGAFWFMEEWTFRDGSGDRHYEDDGPGLGYWVVNYDVLSYSVSGLPKIATAPLPPAAPMLAASLLAMAGATRLRRGS